jgi:hypothetical protein
MGGTTARADPEWGGDGGESYFFFEDLSILAMLSGLLSVLHPENVTTPRNRAAMVARMMVRIADLPLVLLSFARMKETT